MKSGFFSFAALLALSSAARIGKRQDLDFEAYNVIPVLPDVAPPVGDQQNNSITRTYDATSVAQAAIAAATVATTMLSGSVAAISKRATTGSCAAAQVGTGPTVNQPADTPAAFQANAVFGNNAISAVTPFGYNAIYKNGTASAQDSTYMTYTMLKSYDVGSCAAFCQANAGCNSFNIYYERNPSVTPGPTCSNPASLTYIKCAIYGGAVLASSAKNTGQFQSGFQIVIAGSNIYVATAPAAVSGFNGPFTYGNAAIYAPLGYMGVQTFPQSQPYDPTVCAAACDQKSAYDKAHGLPTTTNPDICNFFVAYVLYKDGINGVFTCTYYTYAWSPSYATNVGQYDGQGHHYTIGYSNGYAKVGAPYNGVCTSYGVLTITPTASTSISTTTLTNTASTVTTTYTAVSQTTTTIDISTQVVNAKRATSTATSTCVFIPTATTTLVASTTTMISTVYVATTPLTTLSTIITSTLTVSATTTTTSLPAASPTRAFRLVIDYLATQSSLNINGYANSQGSFAFIDFTSNVAAADVFGLVSATGNIIDISGTAAGQYAFYRGVGAESYVLLTTDSFAKGQGGTRLTCTIDSAQYVNCRWNGGQNAGWQLRNGFLAVFDQTISSEPLGPQVYVRAVFL